MLQLLMGVTQRCPNKEPMLVPLKSTKFYKPVKHYNVAALSCAIENSFFSTTVAQLFAPKRAVKSLSNGKPLMEVTHRQAQDKIQRCTNKEPVAALIEHSKKYRPTIQFEEFSSDPN